MRSLCLPFFPAGILLAFLPAPLPAQSVAPGDSGDGFAAGTRQAVSSDEVPEGLTATEWNGIRAAHEAARYQVKPEGADWQAWNPSQGWKIRFDGRGFTVQPRSGDWTWGLELQSYGFPDRQHPVQHAAQMKAEGGRMSYSRDKTITEWYLNDTRGLEQGFTVHRRPAPEGESQAHDPLTFTLAVRGGLRPQVADDGRGVHFLDEQGALALTYAGLLVTDAEGDTLQAHFEADSAGLRLLVDERGASYPLTIDPIAQEAYLKASNTDPQDFFGSSVSISGNTVVVGAFPEASTATGVNGNQADNSASESGAAYVFVRNGGGWNQEAYLKASNTDVGDRFGFSVAISGDTAVIGAIFEDSSSTGVNGNQADNSAQGAGAAYVFVRNGGFWSQEAYLKASNTDVSDAFGASVAVSGDTIVVGARGESSSATGVNGNQADNHAHGSGAAYVFVRNGGVWSQEAYIKASNTDSGDLFGDSVAISSDTVVVGAWGEKSTATGVNGNQADNSAFFAAGAAYVFVRNGVLWSQEAYIKASNTDSGDEFGISVAILGNTVVIGAPGEKSSATGVNGNQADNSAQTAGAAYVFVRSGGWSQQAYLKASNTDAFDNFGRLVAISVDTVVAGAIGESSSATGVNGNQTDNCADSAGAAYLFVRNAGVWSQQAYLKASNTNLNDEFGWSVAIFADTVVVGAPGERSSATGVNGNQADNSDRFAGAAYVFFSPPPPILIASGEVLSVGSGGTIDYAIDFPPVDAGASYQILLSVNGTGPTTLNGLSIPLTPDRLFQASLNGRVPSPMTGFQGILDANGDGAAQVSFPSPPVALPLKLFGRRFRYHLAVINSKFDLSSKAVSLRFTL